MSVIEPVARADDNPLPHILHVENDYDLAEVLKCSLHDVAHPVLATTLAQARRLLTARSFALVVLDVCLPDGSGLDLLTEIQALGERAPPVVLLCADAPSA
jgi:DNA-binding response OmpR family regulator